MTIPTFDQFVFPLLQVLTAHPDGIAARSAYEEVADSVGVTADDRRLPIPSGLQPLYQNRIAWAHDRLKRHGLSEAPRRGTWRLTESGRQFVSDNPNGLDRNTLRSIMAVPVGSRVPRHDAVADDDVVSSTQSPLERIDAAVAELHASVAEELLGIILKAPPEFFERLVLDVLHAMGYGVSRANLEQTGAVGDGGIDGIITLDRLGLEKVYVQAKRWGAGTVGRQHIQAFYGALAGRRAAKGVFITTSSFTREARDYASSVSGSLVLVDGTDLTSLMIEYGVGVAFQSTVKIARVDSDYFELA